MTDFDETPAPAATTTQPSGKKQVDYFAAVRERGMLNASLDTIAKQYEEDHPGMATRWELYRPGETGGVDNVQHREGQGFRALRYEDIGAKVEGSIVPTEGIIRRGDLVLMAGPREIANQIRLQDAQAAHDDLNAPKAAFEENVRNNQVRLSDGTTKGAVPFGTIKQSQEELAKTGEEV